MNKLRQGYYLIPSNSISCIDSANVLIAPDEKPSYEVSATLNTKPIFIRGEINMKTKNNSDYPFLPDCLSELLGWHTQQTLATPYKDKFTPKKIIHSGPCTIVFWEDDTKTVVRLSENDLNDEYTAFCAALAIKIFGSNSNLKKVIRDKREER